ncbi:alpha,alpha-trehalase TreF [Bauldia sp.]|uniref:alpha,alpha-trehalase TreF n=1 Tax=Bauldia sp. TaxID=2575872 RepID=UPI003BA95A41
MTRFPLRQLLLALFVLAPSLALADAAVLRPSNPDTTALPPAEWPKPPSELFPGLFRAVALADVVVAKDWADAVPNKPVADILSAYERDKPVGKDALHAFVQANFTLPDDDDPEGDLPQGLGMRGHIEALWPLLTRKSGAGAKGSSLIPLPNPYIVPGGRFREVYYWDSYFTMLGFGPDQAKIRSNMIDNFAYLIDRFGFIPNANRTYYLSRSQPPFFFMMVGLLSPDDRGAAFQAYLDELRKEHAFWMDGADGLKPGEAVQNVVRLPDGAILNRYWDSRDVPRDESYEVDVKTASQTTRPADTVYRDLRATAESGWDFSSRWFAAADLDSIETTNILPADLNSLLYGQELAIAAGCQAAGDATCATEYADRAKQRQAAMNAYLWNADLGAFADYDHVNREHRSAVTAAMIYPLFFGVATDDQAAATARLVEGKLLAPGGLVTTTVATHQQWDKPDGWAPLQWLAVNGLRDYGEDDLARTIAQRWLETVARTYCASGRLVEKYNVETVSPGGGGEYKLQDGFGWTNGVTIGLLNLYPNLSSYGDIKPTDVSQSDAARLKACEAALP